MSSASAEDEPRANGGRLLRRGLASMLTSLPLGLLSFALALMIWATVTHEENPSVRRTLPQEVPVEQVNIPRNLLPTGVQPAKVEIVLSGPRSAVNDVRAEDVTVRVDLSRADEELAGAREATVERPLRAEVRRRGVRVETSPELVRVTLERQERRTVPVCVDRIDVTPPGFAVEEPVAADPSEAAITGPRRNVEAVECAAAVVRLTGLTVSVSPQVTLEPRDAAGRPIGGVAVQPATATLSVRVKQGLFPRQVVVDVRLNGRPAPGYSITAVRTDPNVLNIVGPLDVVNAVTAIPTEVIDVEGARSDIVRSVSLQLPPGVSSGERRSVITIAVQAVRAPGSLGVTPRIVNLGTGLIATLTTPTLAVLLSGPLPDVIALRPTDVSVTVDAAGLGAGVHRLEPRVTLPPGFGLDGIVPDRVEITIGNLR